jgi:hypothetical protein
MSALVTTVLRQCSKPARTSAHSAPKKRDNCKVTAKRVRRGALALETTGGSTFGRVTGSASRIGGAEREALRGGAAVDSALGRGEASLPAWEGSVGDGDCTGWKTAMRDRKAVQPCMDVAGERGSEERCNNVSLHRVRVTQAMDIIHA